MLTGSTNNRVYIEDENHWLYKISPWIHNIFSKSYHMQGLVQYDNGELAVVGDTLKWLDQLQIHTLSSKRATKLGFEYLLSEYPEYGGYLQLF